VIIAGIQCAINVIGVRVAPYAKILRSADHFIDAARRCDSLSRMKNIPDSKAQQNKALVLAAFDAAFNARDPQALDRYWSPDYFQHSAHFAPGREGLRTLIASLPAGVRYDHDMVVAEGDLVVLHGRYIRPGKAAWIAADVVRVEDGLLAEHWDLIEDEATHETSLSGGPMFGTAFPE
jgi:predicted SnoaL-like aldol condensation-catalyzing enzyme